MTGLYMKFIFVLRLLMKVKSDHRSKFSNLSNWKELTYNIDKGNTNIFVFSDLERAFDTVDYDTVIPKLRSGEFT